MELNFFCCYKGQQGTKDMKMNSQDFDDLKKIFILKTLVQTGSLIKTAREHRVTASAISQTIKSLEIRVGTTLIVRKDKSWNLTNVGVEWIQKCEPIFKSMEGFFGDSQHVKDLNIKSISLGTYESIALRMVPALTKKIKLDFPKIKLQFHISRTADLVKRLRSGELCLAVVTEIEFDADLKSEILFEDSLGLYVSPQTKGDSGWEQLSMMNHGVISGGQDGLPHYFKEFLRQIPKFQANVVCDSFEVLREMAEVGETVVVLPRRVAAKSKDRLRDITPKNLKHSGKHKIYLLALKDCDQREYSYVAKVLTSLA